MDPLERMLPSTGHILLLSDEVLLMILRHLPSKDLFSMYRTCKRLQNICHEQKLWKYIESPDEYEAVDLVFNRFFSKQTTSLRISSKSHGENLGYRSSLSPSHLAQICPTRSSPGPVEVNLSHLYLIRQKLDKKSFNLCNLPLSLRVLHLSGSMIANVTENSGFFKDVSRSLPNLEDFDLTDCTWVPSHSLMGISKLPSLKRLSLRGCREIGNCLAYSSLAFRFGFSALKILDVTNTQFGTGEFHSVALLNKLEEFYFGEYDVQENSNAIQDFSLHTLIGLNELRIIDLSGQDITDAGLNVLLRIPSLRRVDAHFTAITSGAIERFSQLSKGCVINKNMSYFDY